MPAAAGPSFVGRDDALRKVTGALEAGPALVLIEGEAGIGKTRLLHETLASLPDRPVLLAACPPLPEPFPLGAVAAGLRKFHERIGELELSPLGGALRPLFPEWADRLPGALEPLEEPKETRHRILSALTELIERLEIDAVVVEDAHWADSATLEWLLTLTSAEDFIRSLVVTYRPSDVPVGSLLLRLTSRLPAGWTQARVAVQPLDIEQTRQLVGSMLHADEVSEQFATFLHEHTDGLPLAVEETVRLMRERHDIIRQRGNWTRKVLDDLDVPPTLRDSVLERVERLGPDARTILWAAAVLGEPTDESLLTTVADLDQEAGQRGVRYASRAGLLRHAGDGLLVFRHQLDAKAVEESIPVPDRWGLHCRAAQVLEQLDPPPVVRLARHFREANDTEQWCRYAEAAADLALESGDDRTAVTTLLEVLTAVEHPIDRRLRLAPKLGNAWFWGAEGMSEFADQVVEVLRDVLGSKECRSSERGELRLVLGRALWRDNQERAAFEELEAAIPELGHRPDLAITCMLNLALPVMRDWPAARHLQWLDRAIELAGRAGSPSDRRALAQVRTTTLLLLGEEAGWELGDVSHEPASGLAERRRVAIRLLNSAIATLFWGRYDETRRRLEDAARLIDTVGYQRLVNAARVAHAHLDWYMGAWDGLFEAASEVAASEDTEPSVRAGAQQIVGQLSLVSGARATAEHHLQTTIDEATRQDVVEPISVGAPAALARLYLTDGEPERALVLTAPVVEMITSKSVWLWATDIVQVHSDALIRAGRAHEVETLIRELAAGIEGRHAPAPAAALLGCRAALEEARGNQVQAAQLFADAAAAWATLPRPYDELLAFEHRGNCLLASGQHDDGLTVLSEAQHRLHNLGALWDADRVAQLLRRYGVEVARTWRRGRRGYGDQLSPRELEVVGLVAAGMTNKQIGERLFISPKTVSRHLSAAMRKLAVTSRTKLAVAASEAGLLSPDGAEHITAE